MTEAEYQELAERLRKLADPAFKAFHQKLVPGEEHLLGVRLPVLRKVAKELAREDWRGYLAAAKTGTYEETMLQGLVLGYVKVPADELYEQLAAFVPKIANWAICDSCCAGFKFLQKDRERTLEFLAPYLASQKEFETRFAVVVLMDYFVDEQHLRYLFSQFERLAGRQYYVRMAVAWAISVCFVKFPDETMRYLRESRLDADTYNKALRKIVESDRVDGKAKTVIRSMKRTA